MKIKCPVCKKILVDYTIHALAIHIHEHDKDEIADELADKIFKIHEKIEFWGARHPMVVKEFESLLD